MFIDFQLEEYGSTMHEKVECFGHVWTDVSQRDNVRIGLMLDNCSIVRARNVKKFTRSTPARLILLFRHSVEVHLIFEWLKLGQIRLLRCRAIGLTEAQFNYAC